MPAHNTSHATPFHERHDDELLTLDEVAQILMTSENTVRWWRQIGTGRSSSRSGAGSTPRSATCAAGFASSASHPPRHRHAEGELIVMDWTHQDGPLDPRHVFLHARDVMRRYGWGKTKGYENLKDRELVPPPVMIHPDRWRLDQLLAWEERRMAMAEAALEALVAPDREPTTVTDLLPKPKRRRRSA